MKLPRLAPFVSAVVIRVLLDAVMKDGESPIHSFLELGVQLLEFFSDRWIIRSSDTVRHCSQLLECIADRRHRFLNDFFIGHRCQFLSPVFPDNALCRFSYQQ